MKPLFITKDGVELFKTTDRVFGVTPDFMENCIRFNKDGTPISQLSYPDTSEDPWSFFSTEEKAKEYEAIKINILKSKEDFKRELETRRKIHSEGNLNSHGFGKLKAMEKYKHLILR